MTKNRIVLVMLLISLSNSKNLKKNYSFTVNGKVYSTDKEYSMMKFLREDLGLTSVKDGCDQGACGSCSVIVDGELQKTCVRKIPKFDGKNIITVEGLSDREKEVFTYAFQSCGSVQCGFCTPGMVLAGKALIDENKNPTREDVAIAIRNNICRCTGFVKIIDGIMLAAKIFRENIHDFKKIEAEKIGNRAGRVDAREKILGYGQYIDDIRIDGMIYGGAVRTKYPRARILSIDVAKAKALKGVRSVLTAEDVPNNVNGNIIKDHDVLIKVGDITKFLGDAIVLIAADTEEILEEAKKLVKIEYEELPGVFSPKDALKPDAPKVHERGNILDKESIVRGNNVEEEFKKAAYVVNKQYYTPWSEHAYLERECSIALYDKETGSALVYSSDQSAHETQRMCTDAMKWKKERLVVKHVLIGGGFGGKAGDMTVQHHALLLAYYSGLPVKFKLTRDESILIHPKRHPTWIDLTTGIDKNGKILATKGRIVIDTGAYHVVGIIVLRAVLQHLGGPYNYQNVDLEGVAVYTNNPPAGAFRGLGATQASFAIECNLNLLAEKAGISPWEIRYINAIRPGQRLPFGQLAKSSVGLAETLEAVKDIYEKNPGAGIACGYKSAGMGDGLDEYGRVKLIVKDDVINVHTGGTEMGQGLHTVLTQIVRDVLNVKENEVVVHLSSTDVAPDNGYSVASRTTMYAGEACRRACNQLKEKLDNVNGDLQKLNGQDFLGVYKGDTKRYFPDNTKDPNPKVRTAFGYGTNVVILNEDGSVKKVVAAFDCGKAINPMAVEGQIEGGVYMGLGFAFTEVFPLKNGKPLAKMGQLGLLKSTQMPEIQTVIVEKGKKEEFAFGTNGIGEAVLVPTAPACQNAYFKRDGIFRTELPLKGSFYDKKQKNKKVS